MLATGCGRRLRIGIVLLLLCLALAPAAPAAAIHVLDFESLAPGEAVTEPAPGVLVKTGAPSGHGSQALAVQVRTRGGDDDSDGDRVPKITWRRGNLPRGSELGIVVVVADSGTGRDGHDDDDSDGRGLRFGGSLSIQFGRPMTSLGFDLVDVEGRLGSGRLEFLLAGTPVAEVEFSAFLDPTSPLYDATLVLRKKSGNRFGPFDSALAGAPLFDEVVFHLDGLVALDNVVVAETSPVPEPATLGLVATGLVALGRRRASGLRPGRTFPTGCRGRCAGRSGRA